MIRLKPGNVSHSLISAFFSPRSTHPFMVFGIVAGMTVILLVTGQLLSQKERVYR